DSPSRQLREEVQGPIAAANFRAKSQVEAIKLVFRHEGIGRRNSRSWSKGSAGGRRSLLNPQPFVVTEKTVSQNAVQAKPAAATNAFGKVEVHLIEISGVVASLDSPRAAGKGHHHAIRQSRCGIGEWTSQNRGAGRGFRENRRLALEHHEAYLETPRSL